MKICAVEAELCHEYRQTYSRTASQTDMTKLIVACRNFAKTPNCFLSTQYTYICTLYRNTPFCPHSTLTYARCTATHLSVHTVHLHMHAVPQNDGLPGTVHQLQVTKCCYPVLQRFEKSVWCCFLIFPDFTHLTCAEWPWSCRELLSVCGMILGD
jgi:hypothetical protein